jgi:hypothetical protein
VIDVVTLTIHDIGRADQPDATVRTQHADASAAIASLIAAHGRESIRGDHRFGTVGSLTGRVFQASKTWRIDDDDNQTTNQGK